MAENWPDVLGEGIVGGEHECVAAGGAVGTGVCRGAADGGDGAGDEDAAEC
jgi:hypothetical protein